MTFWQTNNNYGQVLQLFALHKTLTKKNYHPFLIRYYVIPKHKYKWLKLFRHLFEFSRYRFFLNSMIRKEPDRDFDKFRKTHLNITPEVYSSIDELKQINADAIIVGSDQVWNYTLFGDEPDPAFYLRFASDNCKKLSYAASFGFPALPLKFEKPIQDWIKSFHAVSVRDEASKTICEQQLKKEATLVVDPTLLLNKSEYELLFEGTIPSEPYCVFYHLAGQRKVNFQKIKSFCANNNLKYVFIPVLETGFSDAIYPTIGNWLKLIANASFVITNSFHGTCFSIIFQRKFVTIMESGALSKRNTRIVSLLSAFHSTNRIWDYDDCLQQYYETEEFSFQKEDKQFIQQSLDFLTFNLQ